MGKLIFYLEAKPARDIRRELKRYGRVLQATDVNEALFLIADHDFDYYFIDADTTDAYAFSRHLHHDPQLAPPKAVVLLTDNDDEDCEAWCADTFITRSRLKDDLPFVFSHLRGMDQEPAGVLRISNAAPAPDPRPETDVVPPDGEDDVSWELRRKKSSESGKREVPGKSRRKWAFRAAAALMAAAALGLGLFAWGPLSGPGGRENGNKGVKAEETAGDEKLERELRVERTRSGVTERPAEEEEKGEERSVPDEGGEEPVVEGDPPPPRVKDPPTEAAAEVNHPPTVSISGPTQVFARQTAIYTAAAEDPDADGLAYSWGAPTCSRSWSTPGLYSVSVTVTDGRGASVSASISVRVI